MISNSKTTETTVKTRRSSATAKTPNIPFFSNLAFVFLCVALILSTLAYGTVHPIATGIFQFGAAILVLLWAADAFACGALRLNKSLLQIALGAAILLGLIQIIPFGNLPEIAGISATARTISLSPYDTQFAVVQFVALLIYFAATLTFVNKPQRLKTLVFVISIFGFVFAFFAIIQSLIDPNKIYGVYEIANVKPFGSFVNKHNFAAYIEMCIALPLGLLFSGAISKDKRLLVLTAIGLMGIALVMSGSRGGLVALLAAIIFLIFITTKTRSVPQLVGKIALGVALVAAMVAGTFFVGGDSTLTRVVESIESKDPTSSRLQIWEVTLETIRQSPILGNGFGAFGTAYTKFDSLNGRERVEQAHNDYLQILADAGIIGAIIGAFFVFILFRDGFKQINSRDKFRRGVAVGALAGCFAVLVHSFFDFVLHTTAISLLFLMLAALATLGKQVEDENNLEDKPRRKASVTSIESKRRRKQNEQSGIDNEVG